LPPHPEAYVNREEVLPAPPEKERICERLLDIDDMIIFREDGVRGHAWRESVYRQSIYTLRVQKE